MSGVKIISSVSGSWQDIDCSDASLPKQSESTANWYKMNKSCLMGRINLPTARAG